MFFKKKPQPNRTEPNTARNPGATNPLSRRFQVEDERPTTLLQDVAKPAPIVARRPVPEAETRILSEVNQEKVAGEDPMQDPPVGWLVVIAGPGKGCALPIGYGMNALGRAASQRVCLDFGDDRISRENHALVTYDGKSRKFYVQHGGGPNLTYIGETPVLTPVELESGALINLGDTTLRFVPFCDGRFDWLS